MMDVVGLSVAYHAKPKVHKQAMVSVEQVRLDWLMDLFGSLQPTRQ